MVDEEQFLFDLTKEDKKNQDDSELEKEIILSLEERLKMYDNNNLSIFETNQTLDGASESITKTQEKKLEVKKNNDFDTLFRIPDIFKFSDNEKKLYMQNQSDVKKRETLLENGGIKTLPSSAVITNITEQVSFGKTLEKARIACNLSYEEVHNATKIRIHFLKNLEDQKFTDLPAPTYLKSYIKQLCIMYNLSFDIIYQKYLESNSPLKKTFKVVSGTPKYNYYGFVKILYFRYFRQCALFVFLFVLILFLGLFSSDEQKLNSVDLSTFVEQYAIPDYILKIPLNK